MPRQATSTTGGAGGYVRPGLLGIACVFVFAQCSNPQPGETGQALPPSTKVIQVTATTGMIADAARHVGGGHVAVTGLMGPGVDPHLYKATHGDLEKLNEADVILYNGLHLEGRMADVLVKMARRVQTVQVTQSIPEDRLREPPEFDGNYDPHVWFDLSLWRYAVEEIRDTFKALKPEQAQAFDEQAAAYLASLDEMHQYAIDRIGGVPESARVLVTAHDAFGYFGRAYGLEVMGLQGISTASEYGLRDLEDLIDVIVSRKIPAVFVESSISPKSVEALVTGVKAKGHNIRIGGELFSDALGQAGTPEGEYLGMVKHNVDTIAEALQ